MIHEQAKLEGLKIHACILRNLFSLLLSKLIDCYMHYLTLHDALPYVQNLWYATAFVYKQKAIAIQLQQKSLVQCNIPVEQVMRHQKF